MVKTCSKCKTEKNLKEFWKNCKSIDGLQTKCKNCHKQSINKEKAKNIKMLNNYGITRAEYVELCNLWNNCCAICGNKETVVDKRSGKTRELALDHDHKDGTVRAVLCSKCNRGIGMFNENIELLTIAAQYLTNYNEVKNEIR